MFFQKINFSNLTDLDLISKYKETENNVYVGELFKRYTHLVFGVSMKYLKDEDDSKDAVMQIFEKLLSDLLKHEVNNFKSWLHSISKNHCLMHLRSKKHLYTKEIDEDLMESTYVLHQDIEEDQEISLHEMTNGLSQLNSEQKRCVELFYLEEKSYKEIMTLSGYSLNEVKSYIQNGKRNLKNYILKKNG